MIALTNLLRRQFGPETARFFEYYLSKRSQGEAKGK